MLWPASLPDQLDDDQGSVTIEAAFGLAGLVSVTGLALSAMSVLALYISAIDMAGAAARAHALGELYQPKRGTVEYSTDAAWATATVRIDAPFRDIVASATYPVEIVHAP